MGGTNCGRLTPRIPKRKKKNADPDYKYSGPKYWLGPPGFGQAGVLTEIAESQRKKAAEEEAKKTALGQVEEQHTCPITHALFLDPVMANDGHVYERKAIEDWFVRNPHPRRSMGQNKSPMTQRTITTFLTPALQTRNTLKSLIDGGLLTGEAVDTWKAAMKKKEEEAATLLRIRVGEMQGDLPAAVALGVAHEEGLHGLKKDHCEAHKIFVRAANAGSASANMWAGYLLLKHAHLPNATPLGVAYVRAGALLGSEHACAMLARWHKNGSHYMQKDDSAVTFWYKKMLGCNFNRDSSDEERVDATNWLAAHP
jgi:hypothetical protein